MNKTTKSLVGLTILAASATSMDAAAMDWLNDYLKNRGNRSNPANPPKDTPEIDVASGTGAITLVAGAMFLVREKRRRKDQ
jgi:hypothetical protein